jgi:Zn-dependent M16 (insulinase) family peptidase
MVNATLPKDVDYGHFSLLQSFPVENAPVTLSKWRSKRTGLTVVVGNHESPITNGYFTIASEIFDDTGRPHTLEHLIFLGSKEYPYKGVLDQLANRAGSNGTNAWTANDRKLVHVLMISEADCQIPPTLSLQLEVKVSSRCYPVRPPPRTPLRSVYIDHILHPTITDAGFVTEIHHINGAGEDAGVVYSEMQARENQSGDLMALQ